MTRSALPREPARSPASGSRLPGIEQGRGKAGRDGLSAEGPGRRPGQASGEALSFARLLAATALARGDDPALGDASGAWLSFRQLDEQVQRFAGLLAMVRDGDGAGSTVPATIGILAPMGPQAAITVLAALRAGMRPFLIPPDMAAMALAVLLEGHGAEFAIGVDRVGDIEPLHALREAAARVFGLRFVGGFGDSVPDGIVPLDRILAEAFPESLPATVQGRIGLLDVDDPYLPLHDIDEATLLAGGMQVADAIAAAPDSQIVSTLVGGGLATLSTGIAAALVGGVGFLPLGLFDLAALSQALEHPGGSHLVIPASVEEALHDSGWLSIGSVASLVVVGGTGGIVPRSANKIPIVDVRTAGGNGIVATRR